MLLFSRKTEKMFRDFYKRHNSPILQARRDGFLPESLPNDSGRRPPHQGSPGVGEGKTEEREEPGTEEGQRALFLRVPQPQLKSAPPTVQVSTNGTSRVSDYKKLDTMS